MTPNVVIVDNASTDGSLRAAYNAFPNHSYLPLRRNTGFAHAANLIARRASTAIVCYVNPDSELAPDFVERLVEPFSQNDQLGAVAGTLVFDTAPTVIASAGIAIHRNGVAIDRLLGEPLRAGPVRPVFGASGGAVAYRRSALIEAGGYPDVFFMYLEDADLAIRLQLRGWDAVWQPAAIARHAYSASAVEGSPFKRRLIARNRIWMLTRCWPRALACQSAFPMALHDLLASGHGLIRDQASLQGRAEAIARMVPRWCERREIAPDSGDIDRIIAWLQPAISPLELRRKRRLTASLAVSQ